MELHQIDLNLLVVFDQLRHRRRVAQVAEALGLSQPAVSNALARLRKLLGDELFTRTPSGMQPTPFAEQLAEPVANALAMLRAALNQTNSFDPGTSQRSFCIGMTDIGEVYFLPKLMEALKPVAPGINLSTVRDTAVHLRDDMAAKRVDLAIGLLPQLKGGFFQQRLFKQRYVCLFRRGHALDQGGITPEQFSGAEHVLVVSAGTGHGKVDTLLRRVGVARHVRLTVPHFVAVGHILQTTDMVATVPERFAQQSLAPFNLSYAALPFDLPEIAIHLFWHAGVHQDPANQWLRKLIFTMFAD